MSRSMTTFAPLAVDDDELERPEVQLDAGS